MPFRDQNDPACHLLEIVHVVAGHEDGRLLFAIQIFKESDHLALGKNVEPDGRFVEKDQLGLVKQ